MKKESNTKSIKLSRIKISQDFINHMPNSNKLAAKYDYTKNQLRINRKYGRDRNIFQSSVVVDKKHNLVDGYTSYLIAKMFGIKNVNVIIRENHVVDE